MTLSSGKRIRLVLWCGLGIAIPCVGVAAYLFNSHQSEAPVPEVLPPSSPFVSIEQSIQARDLSAALDSLQSLKPTVGELPQVELLKGNCYRLLRDLRQMEACLSKAEGNGANREDSEALRMLSQIAAGDSNVSRKNWSKEFSAVGQMQAEIQFAKVLGLLNQREWDSADREMASWESDTRGDGGFLRGRYWQSLGQMAKAEASYREALQRNPRHELAQVALVDLLELPTGSLVRCLEEAKVLHANFPQHSQATLRLVRVLRKLGSEIPSSLELDRMTGTDGTAELARFERSELYFDQGRYEESHRELLEAGLKSPSEYQQMIDQAFRYMTERDAGRGETLFRRANLGAMTLAFSGNRQASQSVFETLLNRLGRLRRLNDLYAKQVAVGTQPATDREIQQLINPSESRSDMGLFGSQDGIDKQEPEGWSLYQSLCAHCHGIQGDGLGRAARHLFPSPRDFRNEPMHFVSSSNGLASDDDLIRTVREGISEASMPGYPKLSDGELASLIRVLRAFQRSGMEQRFKGQGVDPIEREDLIMSRLKAAAPLTIPPVPENRQATDTRGASLLRSMGCLLCHPSDQAGRDLKLFDHQGQPVIAPELTKRNFKGGNTFEAIYARLALGIPGTPHPALAAEEKDLVALASYLESLPAPSDGESPSTNASRRAVLVETR